MKWMNFSKLNNNIYIIKQIPESGDDLRLEPLLSLTQLLTSESQIISWTSFHLRVVYVPLTN